MKVINLFESDRQEYWLGEMRKCDWNAGAYLAQLITDGQFFQFVGEKSKMLMLTDGDDLISFCTYAERDDIPSTDLTPWMGFVYTFPAFRGHRYVGLLAEEVSRLAKADGFTEFYVSTSHTGLYEKYGCVYKTQMTDWEGVSSRIYVRKI